MKELILSAGKKAIVDSDMYDDLNKFKWSYTKGGYAIRWKQTNKTKEYFYLHRFVIGAKPGEIVDHINRNKLDCRRENLRFSTTQQNAFNQIRKAPTLTSPYKGVTFWKRDGNWRSQAMMNYKQYNLGYYDTPIEAAQVYDLFALTHFKEFAKPNFACSKILHQAKVIKP